MGQVRVGFFQDFKSSDTVLIDGDRDGLRSLSSAFRQLASTGTTQIALHELSFVETHHGLQIHAFRASRDAGTAFQSAGVITWACSESAWESAAAKIDVLAEQGFGHQYLDELSNITVMASIAEYGGFWWRIHGHASPPS
jgi:hypothetical protein